MSKFHIYTLGCKVNQYESEAIGQYLETHGWEKSQDGKDSDICIINTCTVTGKGSMQSRQAVRNIIRSNPQAKIIVTGCYAQTETEEIKKIDGVHYIIGTSDKHLIPEMILSNVAPNDTPETPRILVKSLKAAELETLEDLRGTKIDASPEINSSNEKEFFEFPMPVKGKKARPYLKIQEGCNAFCSYCIVPHARGRSRSMAWDNVLGHLKDLTDSGYFEAVLTGIHVGMYGLDLTPKATLFSLLETIAETRAIGRLRLGSIEPKELTCDIIKLVSASKHFCDHFHIPLQSGDDEILRRMKRPYTGGFFRELVAEITEKNPLAAIGADTLIGFPGETEEHFENTFRVIEELPVSYLHVFPYSRRYGTPAYDYPDQVDPAVLKERCRRMRELSSLKKMRFMEKNLGQTAEIIVERKRDPETGMLKGVSSNYITVLTEGNDLPENSVAKVKLTDIINEHAMKGTLL